MIHNLILLAQTTQVDFNRGDSQAGFFAAIAAMLVVILVVIAIFLAIQAGVCYLISSMVKAIPAANRKVEPGSVWLMMIPCFNLYWAFPLYQRIAESFMSYFQAQGRTDVGDCGKQLGLWAAICLACGVIPILNYVAGPAHLVCLIMLLVKWNGLKASLPPAA